MKNNISTSKTNDNFIVFTQWALFILTILTVVIYPFLPQKKLIIFPSTETVINLNASSSSGAIETKWLDKQAGAWQCTLQQSESYSICGVYLNWFNKPASYGRDLSNFEHIKLNVNYQGSANKIRLFLRNFDGSYASEQDGNSPQYLNTEFRQRDLLNNEITISLTEITVADWWIDQYQHPRSRAIPKFDNISAFGIEVFGNNLEGIHDITLDSIEFTGPLINEKQYYFTILVIWLLVVLFYLTRQLYLAKKHATSITLRGEELAKSNEALAKEKDKYRELSTIDSLTKVPNRHSFEEFILNCITTASKDVSLIMLDIDYFKKINDNYGHDIGDVALKKLATLVQNNIRSNDYFARWGGEEFIICCMNSSVEESYKHAEKLRILVEEYVFTEIPQLKVTISLGIAIRDPNESFKSWFNRADQALYQAKAEGRNKTVFNHKTS